MTPKEKAVELVEKYLALTNNRKQCAIIAVEEILKMPNIEYSHNRDSSQYDYWQQVKEEIEKL